jgi:hypothetical protein
VVVKLPRSPNSRGDTFHDNTRTITACTLHQLHHSITIKYFQHLLLSHFPVLAREQSAYVWPQEKLPNEGMIIITSYPVIASMLRQCFRVDRHAHSRSLRNFCIQPLYSTAILFQNRVVAISVTFGFRPRVPSRVRAMTEAFERVAVACCPRGHHASRKDLLQQVVEELSQWRETGGEDADKHLGNGVYAEVDCVV